MKQNDCSNNIIKQDPVPVNTGPDNLPDPLPGLKGMKGGEKQHWNNENRELIALTYDQFGPDYTKALYNLKDTTLSRVLRSSERKHRPSYRKADQAMNKAYLNEDRILKLKPEVEAIGDALLQHFDNDQELRQTLANYFQLQARLNDMVAQLVQKQGYIMSNFTEHISSETPHEVDPTRDNLTLTDPKRIKAGPTSSAEDGRFLISNKGKAGKRQSSRPGRSRGSLRERYQNSKRRRYHRD